MTRIADIVRVAPRRAGLVLLVLVFACTLAPRLAADQPQPPLPAPVAGGASPEVSPQAPVASDDANAGVRVDLSLIKRPSDFAPLHRVIVGRNDREIRKPGSLLSSAAGSIPKVDQNDLYKRTVAMHQGQRIFSSPTYVDRPNFASAASAAAASAQETSAASGSTSWLLLLPLLGLLIFYVLIRLGILNRKSDDESEPKPKAPRLKVTLANH